MQFGRLGAGMARLGNSTTIPGFVLPGAAVDMNFSAGLYFGGSLSSLVSCTRAQTVPSYATDASGNLISFSANTPRITSAGLLVEQGSTNLSPDSNLLSSWTPGTTGTTVAQNAVDPTGAANSAWTVTQTAASAANAYVQQNLTIANDGTSYCISEYVAKTASPLFIKLVLSFTGGTGLFPGIVVNTLTGAISNSFGGGAGTVTSAGNFWRIQIVIANNSSGNTTLAKQFWPSTDSSGNSLNGGFSVVAFWNTEPLAFPTSYIPTTTVSVARNADNVQAIGALLAALNGVNMSVILATNQMQNQANFGRLISWTSDGNNSIALDSATNTDVLARFSSSNLTVNLGTGSTKTALKLGIGVSAGGRSVVANNGTVATNATTLTTSSTVYLGSADGASLFGDGVIPRLTAFTSRLPDASLKAMTQ